MTPKRDNRQDAIDALRMMGFECIESMISTWMDESPEIVAEAEKTYEEAWEALGECGQTDNGAQVHDVSCAMMLRQMLLVYIRERYGPGAVGQIILNERARGLP